MFFCSQKVEKTTSKSCILMAVWSFFLCSPICPKQPRTSYPFYKLFYATISCRISGPSRCLPLYNIHSYISNAVQFSKYVILFNKSLFTLKLFYQIVSCMISLSNSLSKCTVSVKKNTLNYPILVGYYGEFSRILHEHRIFCYLCFFCKKLAMFNSVL